jgi:hypothetical protein
MHALGWLVFLVWALGLYERSFRIFEEAEAEKPKPMTNDDSDDGDMETQRRLTHWLDCGDGGARIESNRRSIDRLADAAAAGTAMSPKVLRLCCRPVGFGVVAGATSTHAQHHHHTMPRFPSHNLPLTPTLRTGHHHQQPPPRSPIQSSCEMEEIVTGQVNELKKLFRSPRMLLAQSLNLAMIVFSALMIWKGLMFATKSESPVVVVLRSVVQLVWWAVACVRVSGCLPPLVLAAAEPSNPSLHPTPPHPHTHPPPPQRVDGAGVPTGGHPLPQQPRRPDPRGRDRRLQDQGPRHPHRPPRPGSA